jgi:hypothetical protein
MHDVKKLNKLWIAARVPRCERRSSPPIYSPRPTKYARSIGAISRAKRALKILGVVDSM